MLLIRLYMLSMNSASSVNCCIMHGPWCIVWFELVFRSFSSRLWKCFIYISGINQFKYEANAALLLCSSLSVFSDLDGFKWKWNAAFHYQIKAFPEVAQTSNQIHEKIGQIFFEASVNSGCQFGFRFKIRFKIDQSEFVVFCFVCKINEFNLEQPFVTFSKGNMRIRNYSIAVLYYYFIPGQLDSVPHGVFSSLLCWLMNQQV